ncbi:MAG: Na/Pi cotransporter family protein [Clostridia bacterium]|nr:Na/Pi cotransporter family protein [Clostridia bacterium]
MSIETIMFLVAGLGAFLIGFKILSENLAKFAGRTMRNMFNKISGNKFAGIAIGAGSTALIQSSAATTVMLIGFANAGIITLYQAVPIIMGANIGTTVTALILSLDAIDVPLFAMGLSLIGIFGAKLVKKDRTKSLFLAIAGMGLVFFGLKTMSTQMSVVAKEPFVTEALDTVTFPLLLLAIGIVFTIVMQSSTAVTGILLSMAGAGLTIGNGGNSIYYVILGTNIGTCLTAILSSMGASTNAKRTAVIHLMFNVVGSLIFLIVLWIWSGFNDFWSGIIPSSKMQIALFHMTFNLICTIIFLPFTNVFVKVAEWLVPVKKDKTSSSALLDERLLEAPNVAVGYVVTETKRMAGIAMNALNVAFDGFMNRDQSVSEVVQDNMKSTAQMNSAITGFIVKLSTKNVGLNGEKIITAVHASMPDIERLAELAENVTKYTTRYVEQELTFSDSVMKELGQMFEAIRSLYDSAMRSLDLNVYYNVAEAEQLENNIDAYKKSLLDGHMIRLNDGTCSPESSGVFINLVNNLERAGDHLYFIAEAFAKLNEVKQNKR